MADNLHKLGKDIDIAFLTLDYQCKKYLKSFSCGNSEIDRYFHYHALDDPDTITYMFIDKCKDIAITLVSVSCSKIDYWQDKKYLNSTPAIEIKYFATDERYHSLPFRSKDDNVTLSKSIMSKMICYISENISTKIGASKIILNSVEDAIHFYQDCYFNIYDSNMDIDYSCLNDGLTPMYFNLLPDAPI